MAELSPAAQAVLDATAGTYGNYQFTARSRMIAADLQAAADRVVPAEDEDVYLVPWRFTEHMRQRQHTRRQFLAIAAELEGQL
jgi:hypothetical protein